MAARLQLVLAIGRRCMKPLALILMTASLVAPVFGQAAPEEEDGPGRGVARLSVMNGEVSVRRGDSGDLVAAAVNAPLVITDRVLTGPSSRAELQFDYANMLRIGANGEVRLSELESKRYQIQIAVGTTTFRVLRDSDAQVELSTPSVALRPVGRGIYRVTVHEDGSVEITVRAGEAEILTPRGSERLGAGRTVLARGTANDPEVQIVAGMGMDEWDRWNDNRDRDLERSQAYNYVSPDVYGAEDLDNQGTWVDVPSYGQVWRPTVVDGWAPYRNGRWAWVDYYGWTWVSYDSWGWAPYHYGRWFNQPGFGWCWWPGGRGHTYWRPALVAFFGFGGRGGVGFGFGNVGWVPLAPHEPFHPWYGRGYYGRSTLAMNGFVNGANIMSSYRNARVSNGITGVASENFGRGRVGSNWVRPGAGDLEHAGLVRGQLPLAPGRESLRLSDRQASVASRVGENRRFYSERPAASIQRVPFEQQRQRIEQSTRGVQSEGFGRGTAPPVGTGTTGGWRREGVTPQVSPTVAPSQQQGNWHQFGTPNQHTGAPQGSAVPQTRAQENWRRFGDPNGRAPQASPQIDRTAPAYSAPAQPRQQYRQSQRDSGQGAPMRISPPIVRERSAPAPRMESSRPQSGGGGNRGGGSSSGGGGDHGRRSR